MSPIIQQVSEADGGELTAAVIWSTFVSELVEVEGLISYLYDVKSSSAEKETCEAVIKIAESEISIAGEGSGPIDAFVSALSQSINEPLNVVDYQEYALNETVMRKPSASLPSMMEKVSSISGSGLA